MVNFWPFLVKIKNIGGRKLRKVRNPENGEIDEYTCINNYLYIYIYILIIPAHSDCPSRLHIDAHITALKVALCRGAPGRQTIRSGRLPWSPWSVSAWNRRAAYNGGGHAMCTIFKNASPVGKKSCRHRPRSGGSTFQADGVIINKTARRRAGKRRKKKKYGEPVPGFVFMSLFDFSFLLELRPWPVVPRRPLEEKTKKSWTRMVDEHHGCKIEDAEASKTT